jgi:hypothetical protein
MMSRPAESRHYIGRMGQVWSIANVIDYRGLLAELVSSSAAVHAIIGPGICGPCPWEF